MVTTSRWLITIPAKVAILLAVSAMVIQDLAIIVLIIFTCMKSFATQPVLQ